MADTEQDQKKYLNAIISDLNEMNYAGKLRSVAYIAIDTEGRVKISQSTVGSDFLITAGLCHLLQNELISHAQQAKDKPDYLE